jgi:hypothetical protein
MRTIEKLIIFTAILGAACGEYVDEPEAFDDGAPSDTDESVGSIQQGLISAFWVFDGTCDFGFVCVYPVADWQTDHDLWGLGLEFAGCGWVQDVAAYSPDFRNSISAIINNQQPGAVSYFYDARGAGSNDDLYIGQSQAFDYIGDLQTRVAADGSNPNDRIDYIHVTQPGCVE